MDYDKTEIATNDDKNSCSGASKRFSACRRQRHRAARSGGGDAGGSDGRGPQRDSDIRQTPRPGRKISRSRDPKSVEQAQPDLRGAGRGAQATFRDVTPGASINARSGRILRFEARTAYVQICAIPGRDPQRSLHVDCESSYGRRRNPTETGIDLSRDSQAGQRIRDNPIHHKGTKDTKTHKGYRRSFVPFVPFVVNFFIGPFVGLVEGICLDMRSREERRWTRPFAGCRCRGRFQVEELRHFSARRSASCLRPQCRTRSDAASHVGF